MPAGRDDALALALVPVGAVLPDFDALDAVDPTVLLVSPDGPVASVPLRSRTTLLLTSQHLLVDVPLELDPVPCAFATLPSARNAAPHAAAR